MKNDVLCRPRGRPAGDCDRLPPPASAAAPRLGEILLASGEISERQLAEALERRKRSGRLIGQELVATGLVSADRLRRALRLQRRIFIAALFGAVVGQANAADVRAHMSVSARVVDTVRVRALYQAQTLVITPKDIERGYVEVAEGSRFEVTTRGPCLFEFKGVDDVFRSVRVSGLPSSAEFGAHGGTLLQKPSGAGGTAAVALNYRFELKPGVEAGVRQWPLALTVLPM